MRLGYRQKAVLQIMRAHGGRVPVGLLIRLADAPGNTVYMALTGLRKRGLVRNVKHGVWELA